MRAMLTRIWQTLLIDWQQKTQQILLLERDIAGLLVQTPWVLMMSHPGINVISAAELAGETGPIEQYASAKSISGRAGLFPSRYQSDSVDRGYILDKLLTFHREHDTPMSQILADLKSATDLEPKHAHADESKPLQEVQRKSLRNRKSGPLQINVENLLVAVLARLGVTIVPPAVNSTPLVAPAAESDKGDR